MNYALYGQATSALVWTHFLSKCFNTLDRRLIVLLSENRVAVFFRNALGMNVLLAGKPLHTFPEAGGRTVIPSPCLLRSCRLVNVHEIPTLIRGVKLLSFSPFDIKPSRRRTGSMPQRPIGRRVDLRPYRPTLKSLSRCQNDLLPLCRLRDEEAGMRRAC